MTPFRFAAYDDDSVTITVRAFDLGHAFKKLEELIADIRKWDVFN